MLDDDDGIVCTETPGDRPTPAEREVWDSDSGWKEEELDENDEEYPEGEGWLKARRSHVHPEPPIGLPSFPLPPSISPKVEGYFGKVWNVK